ncbi:MAG: TrbI/VirB10 family protein [Legionella sp.]|nr:TrbI/VirB10 family protein [Legionella sp.]
MTHHDTHTTENAASARTQVASSTLGQKLKDRMLLVGAILICILIGLGALLPSHKTQALIESHEEADSANALNQNMELIATLKERSQMARSGTQGGTPTHPPLLRTKLASPLTQETMARMNAPTTFYSANGESHVAKDTKNAHHKTLTGDDANSQFLNQQEDIALVSARHLPHPGFTVPAGEMIPATLETAINPELAGMARAITLRDIFALSGNRVLIPKGSTLIGQFNTAITSGQSRIFVVWNRIQMSNGITASLNSPSADTLGRAGIAADYIDRHFFERFGSGALLSVLGAYTATSGVNGQDEYNSRASYRTTVANNFQQSANQTLQHDMQIPTTLQSNQGASITVFVAHDLDFRSVAGKY